MDFKELLQKMQHIEEGMEYDPEIEECGDDMPAAIIHGDQHADESLNMNLTINSKGADGIRDLIDVLKGIGGDTEPKDIPHDDDSEIVIGDDYENSVDGDAGSKVFDTDAVIFKGNDMHSKGRSAVKVNGGENPQIHHESLISNLAALYEDVKDRLSKSEKRAQSDQAVQDFIKSGGSIKKHEPQKEPSKKPYSPPKSKKPSNDEFKLRNDDGSIAKISNIGFRKEPPIVNPNRKKHAITPDWEDKLAQLGALKHMK